MFQKFFFFLGGGGGGVPMPSSNTNILQFNQCQKSDMIPSIIYAHLDDLTKI